jgi:uncharacterized protein YyaL (SSP411 family)
MGDQMANRLATETSPYLRQHADNPVEWYPWGPEALERAAREDKPILLSIGYAACHWCHVMAHESFEDPETAQVMNDLFVNIKVDREERPDIDSVYMQAVQSMTGHGGWPMTMFLTPTGEPFYAGTYFPPRDRPGMPAFRRVLRSVADAYHSKRDRVEQTAAAMREIYAASTQTSPRGRLGPETLDRAYRTLAAQYDAVHGGFNGAPKFPPTMDLEFLLAYSVRTGTAAAAEMALDTFRQMARGGIYDQVGGGFHRYAVDDAWQVPHFEKMLYDNALLIGLGTHLWQSTHDDDVRRVTEATVDWVRREMTDRNGGFYSSLDADSEGEEGKYYVWDESELDIALGPDSAVFKAYYGVTPAGNFEGHNILHVDADPAAVARRAGITLSALGVALSRARQTVFAVRERRVRPGRDEKQLAAWNGLMLRAVAQAARVFGRPEDAALAIANAEFLSRELARPNGRVMRTHTQGTTKIPGYLEDHATVALGFLATYELTFDRAWLDRARSIAAAIGTWFWDQEPRTFFDTARDAETLITRPRDVTDNAIPSGTALAIELYLRLGELFDDDQMRSRALNVLETLAEPMANYPTAFGHALGDADMAIHGAATLVIVGAVHSPSFESLLATARPRYVPSLVIAGGATADAADLPILGGRRSLDDGSAVAYLCRNRMCNLPQADAQGLAGQLDGLTGSAADRSHV